MKNLTTRDKNIISSSSEIIDFPAGIEKASFMHLAFCQLGLPRSSRDTAAFERSCGGLKMIVEIDRMMNCDDIHLSIPYGSVPRLLLMHICKQATMLQTTEIDMKKSATALMKSFGLSTSGGLRGSCTNFKNQLRYLLMAKFTLISTKKGKEYCFHGKLFQIENTKFHLNKKWIEKIYLSEAFYENLIMLRNSVPIDERALYALKGSALEIDIYLMLSERLHRIKSKPVMLYWQNLREQFGQEYAKNAGGKKSFKRNFIAALKHVLLVYQDACVEVVDRGIKLSKSLPPIPKHRARVHLPNFG